MRDWFVVVKREDMIVESDWRRLGRRVHALTIAVVIQAGTSAWLAAALIWEARRG